MVGRAKWEGYRHPGSARTRWSTHSRPQMSVQEAFEGGLDLWR